MKEKYCVPVAELTCFIAGKHLATAWDYEKVTSFDAYRSNDPSPSEADVPLPTYPDGEY